MNIHESCDVYLAKITPHRGKTVFSFFHLLVLCTTLFHASCCPCVFPSGTSTLCLFSNKEENGKGRFSLGMWGAMETSRESFLLARR